LLHEQREQGIGIQRRFLGFCDNNRDEDVGILLREDVPNVPFGGAGVVENAVGVRLLAEVFDLALGDAGSSSPNPVTVGSLP